MYFLAHHLHLILVSLGVAYLMMLAGVQKNALEWRRSTRTCPSCGRETFRCRCR